jgi:hypothetical protein
MERDCSLSSTQRIVLFGFIRFSGRDRTSPKPGMFDRCSGIF